MILQSLVALARRESLVVDPCFEYAKVSWAVDVGSDGTFDYLFDLRTESGEGKKKRLLPRQMLVPKRSKRTVQDLAEFLVDKPEYVLGLGERKAEQMEPRRILFAEGVRAAAAECGCSLGFAVSGQRRGARRVRRKADRSRLRQQRPDLLSHRHSIPTRS